MTLCPAAAVHVVNGLRNYCMRLFLASSFGHSVLGCVDCLSQMFCQGVISHSCFQLRERERNGGAGEGCYLYFVYSVVPKGVCVPFQKFRSLSLCSVVLSGFIVPLGKQSHPPPHPPSFCFPQLMESSERELCSSFVSCVTGHKRPGNCIAVTGMCLNSTDASISLTQSHQC